jgi:hypothetical protein
LAAGVEQHRCGTDFVVAGRAQQLFTVATDGDRQQHRPQVRAHHPHAQPECVSTSAFDAAGLEAAAFGSPT